MLFEDIPLFKISLKLLKFCSLLLCHNWRRYACLVPTFILSACQFADLFITTASLDTGIRIAYDLVLWFNANLRAVSIVYHRYRYESFIKELSRVYKETETSEGTEVKRLLGQTSRIIKTIEMMNLLIGITVAIGISLLPLFGSSRALPFSMYIPVFDKYKSPLYEIIYIYQCVITPAGFCMFMPFMNMMVTFLMFCIFMCKALQYHLRNLKNLKTDEVWPKVVWCIRYQNQIIRYVEEINTLTTYVYMLEFLAFGPLVCVLLFLLNMVQSLAQFLLLFCYFTMIFSQVVTMCWIANELSVQSAAIATAAYDSNWCDFDLKTKKALILFIARAQKPCFILVGQTFPMSLVMLQSMLNVTYSYFTLLRQVYG